MKVSGCDTFTVGKTTVTVTVAGCVDCGSQESIGCESAVHHMFQFGNRRRRIELKRCADCAEKQGAHWPAEMRNSKKALDAG
jgi:hypothetical protein